MSACLPQYLPYFFFFNDTATTEIYTLSLHDALPIYRSSGGQSAPARAAILPLAQGCAEAAIDDRTLLHRHRHRQRGLERSEEHTSELQSQSNLVCRLLLEKKKKTTKPTNRRSIRMTT